MERSLDIQLLEEALASQSGLPTAEQLQEHMAQAEIALVLNRSNVDEQLMRTAWYLHGVASVSDARQRYTTARQRQAFLVSAHIFDLALASDEWGARDRLSIGFAAAIGYRRGGRDPNASAIIARLEAVLFGEDSLDELRDENLSLRVGLIFLSFDSKTAFAWLSRWRRHFVKIAQQAEMDSLRSTALGSMQALVLGVEDILSFLVRGDYERYSRGSHRLHEVALGNFGGASLDARWVATHLMYFAGVAEAGSPWNPAVLPPSTPSVVRQAFAVGSPAILTLWEPQRELLTGEKSPLSQDVKRIVLSVPTSGGKTLVAQLLAVAHLAQTGKSVCFVVPTRSLGREIRRAMSGRVRILQKEVAAEKPDFSIWLDGMNISGPQMGEADVDVMTPERLSHLLRNDFEAVLDKYSLFIFDEAQLLKERGRGFVLESVISALNVYTRDRSHRIILLSAAMGNVGGVAQWLDPDGGSLTHTSDWRGPRRLHAVFNTEAEWDQTVTERGAGKVWPYRHTTPLSGLIRLRLGNGSTKSLYTAGDTGWRLVRKSKNEDAHAPGAEIDSTRNTKNYSIASGMITALGHAGSVLVVASTKKQAQTLAQAIAAELGEQPKLASLVDFVRQQLGDAHPLVGTLRRGVGFHHAGLPVEVLEALEGAVRSDDLPYLTCTSTLTDGVNLPVRTVVLYDNPYPGQPDDTRLRGARLVNAMGRAGRAGKETEGWIVLVKADRPRNQDFAELNPGGEDLNVTSSLLSDLALQAVAEIESSQRADADAVFSASGAAADFISFVWMMLAEAERQMVEPARVDVDAVVRSTLAATQSVNACASYTRIAKRVRNAYLSSDSAARQRWSRVGCSIGSARKMDGWATNIAIALLSSEQIANVSTPDDAVAFLQPTIAELLRLPEAPRWGFRESSRGSTLEIDATSVLRDWLYGASLPVLADKHLVAVRDPAWKIEQIVTATTEHFEHYLSWTVGALVDLVNSKLQAVDSETVVCPELGGYIRYGVGTPIALELAMAGIRSRRIANLVSQHFERSTGEFDSIEDYLATLGVPGWRREFAASASEVLDLLEFTRPRRRSLLRNLLDDSVVKVPVQLDVANGSGPLRLSAVDGETHPAPFGLYQGAQLLGMTSARDHTDIQSILDTGFAIRVELEHSDGIDQARITLLDALDERLF